MKRQPGCVFAHILIYCSTLNFPGELTDKRSLIKERGQEEEEKEEDLSFHLDFQEWYPWQPGKQDIIKRVKRS